MASRFVPNPAGVVALLHEAFMRACVADATEELERTARAGSPDVTGHFIDSFDHDVEDTATGPVGHLTNDDPGAAAIEFGSIHNDPFSPMRRAARALGLDLRGDR